MIHVDLSKTPSLRAFVYLLALFPGMIFLSSVALGNPALAGAAVEQVRKIYPFPPYGLAIVLLGAAFVIGQGFILFCWMLEMLLRALYQVARAGLLKALRRVFCRQQFSQWFAKYQGVPPRTSLSVRVLNKLMALASVGPTTSPEAQAAWSCLVAATEKLMERRYGIEAVRASGSVSGTWDLWCSVLGKPVAPVIESLNVGRTFLGCGVAGFLAISFAPMLHRPYFVALCSIFTLSGLWTAAAYFFRWRDPAWRHSYRLRSVLLELQEWSTSEAGCHKVQSGTTDVGKGGTS